MARNRTRDEEERPDESTGGPSPEGVLSLDEILSLLANPQRRTLLEYLSERPDESHGLEECADHLLEHGTGDVGGRHSHEQVAARLHHVHAPKLADAGVLEYDPRSQELRYRCRDRLETVLDSVLHGDVH